MTGSHKPKVAFFMSCYNHEQYVAEAIDSIVNQTYPHWELFVVNDGSTDRTGEIIASYRDERIHFYNLSENTKFAGAIEMLYDIIEPLDFDYVHSMASDDKIDPHKLEKQICFFEKHPRYAACFTWDKLIFEDQAESFIEDYSHVDNRSRYSWLDYFFDYGNCMNGNSALIRKDVFYRLDTVNERYICLGDFRLWFMIAEKYPIYVIREELTYYRRHATNLSKSGWQNGFLVSTEFERVMKDIIFPMEKDTFRRAYYSKLVYKDCESDEAFLAEKFILLVNGSSASRRQAAIDFYFNHCSNRAFTKTLKEKYGFDNSDFTYLKENAGLTNAINEIAVLSKLPPFIETNEPKKYRAWSQLLRTIQAGGFGPEAASQFTWASLWQLCILRKSGDEAMKQFLNIKMLLQKIRELHLKTMRERHVLFIADSSTDWRLNSNTTPVSPGEHVSFYVAHINKQDILSADTPDSPVFSGGTDLEGVRTVSLFDKKEESLRFADEVIDGLTDICYVDTLLPDYECYDMIKGYSLLCSQTAIMKKALYDAFSQKEADLMQLMDGVYYYE